MIRHRRSQKKNCRRHSSALALRRLGSYAIVEALTWLATDGTNIPITEVTEQKIANRQCHLSVCVIHFSLKLKFNL